jgi:tol-pal system protein YbgF
MVEMLYRLDQLQKELRQIRGDMEVVNHELTGIKRRQRELYLDIDRRLSDLEAGGVRKDSSQSVNDQPGQQIPISANDASPAVEAPAVDQVLPPSREEKDAYRGAFNLLKEGRYDQSIKAFTGFLAQYPNSTYADNAQYWLGEANYVSRKYPAAVTEFNKVIVAFPNSSKVPDAMLKLGFTHYELKEWNKAREILSSVVQKYPDSSAAKLADTRLQRLKNEGH